jgi:hypothetical protein
MNPSSKNDLFSDQWGASGTRLVLSVNVMVQSHGYPDTATEREFMGGTGASNILAVASNATYLTVQRGLETVQLASTGAWKVSSRRNGSLGTPSVVRFWLDVQDNAAKNDVVIPAGTRLYGTAPCWRQSDYAIHQARLLPLQRRIDAAQAAMDQRLDHAYGDRRLDGTNLVDTVGASLDMARLVAERDEAVRAWREYAGGGGGTTAAARSCCSPPGPWPGSNEALIVGQGAISALRSRRNNEPWRMFLGRDYCTIGTWTATPIPSQRSETTIPSPVTTLQNKKE